jgi:hypothetical protein
MKPIVMSRTAIIRLLALLFAAAGVLLVSCTFGSDRTKHNQTIYNETFAVNPTRTLDLVSFSFTAGDTISGHFNVHDSGQVDFFVFGSQAYHNGPRDSAHAIYSRLAVTEFAYAFPITSTDTAFFEFTNQSGVQRTVTLVITRSFWEEN